MPWRPSRSVASGWMAPPKCSVIVSTPRASTCSNAPESTARHASWNADVPEAHAFSIVRIGTSVMPHVCSARCTVPGAPNTVPANTASIVGDPASSSASNTARRTRSPADSSGCLPNSDVPTPCTATSRHARHGSVLLPAGSRTSGIAVVGRTGEAYPRRRAPAPRRCDRRGRAGAGRRRHRRRRGRTAARARGPERAARWRRTPSPAGRSGRRHTDRHTRGSVRALRAPGSRMRCSARRRVATRRRRCARPPAADRGRPRWDRTARSSRSPSRRFGEADLHRHALPTDRMVCRWCPSTPTGSSVRVRSMLR